MSMRRKLAAVALTGGILVGAAAVAAPANATTWVSCPTNGTEIDGNGSYCYAGTPGYGFANIYDVYRVSTDYNNFTFWDNGTPIWQRMHVDSFWNDIHVTGVQIDN